MNNKEFVAKIAELAKLGTRAAVVMTAGMDSAQKKAMLDAARPHLLRILGPNCIGLLAPHRGLNASFAHVAAAPGELAFVSQSGALVTAMLDWADAQQIGFSHFVSLGEHMDVDFGDMLDYLATDARTRAILLYIESIEAPRKFILNLCQDVSTCSWIPSYPECRSSRMANWRLLQ
mgnify:CR=1 FL=1